MASKIDIEKIQNRLLELKEASEKIGVKDIVFTIINELEDAIFWELDADQSDESLVEYCQNQLLGWQSTAREILDIIDKNLINEISILNEIIKLKINT